jgi:ribonuclease P protein component
MSVPILKRKIMQHPSFSLRPAMRVRRSQDFEKIYERGLRAGDGHLLVFAVISEQPQTRAGLSVSRKHGSAVIRNRKRRLLREAFRLSQHQLPSGLDLVLIPRQRTDSSLQDFSNSLVQLTRYLQRQLQRRGVHRPE